MKQKRPSSKWLRVEQPEAARLLVDPKAARFLEPLISREWSVAELAAELQVDMSSVLYRIRQFIKLGLVKETRRKLRGGRPVRYYRSVAEGFYVPFSATPYTSEEAISPQAFGLIQNVLTDSVGAAWSKAAEQQGLGIHLFRREDGEISRNIVPDPDDERPYGFFEELLDARGPAVWDTWNIRKLSRKDAKALQKELATVFERYRADDAKGQEYIIRLAMAPVKK